MHFLQVDLRNGNIVDSIKTTWYKTADEKLFFKIDVPAWKNGFVYHPMLR